MLSKYTAFIAVHENDKAVEGTMQTRNVNELSQQKMKKKGSMYNTSILSFIIKN